MTSSTMTYSARAAKTWPVREYLRRMLDAMVEARLREAEREIARTLASFSDHTLAEMGLSRADIASGQWRDKL